MNIQDVGNRPLSLAFKSRFHHINIKYTKKEHLDILDKTLNLKKYEKRLFDEIYDTTKGWHTANEIRFPCGVRHYTTFFKFLREGLKGIVKKGKKLIMKHTDRELGEFLVDILRSAIMMPIIDENQRGIVESKEEIIESMGREDLYKIIKEFAEKNGLDDLETLIYF
jgi:hypothetical protein